MLTMGSMALMCPMCCNETFENSVSLKNHLLKLSEDLCCPGCLKKTYSIAALIEHLDVCGKELDQDVEMRESSTNDFESISNTGDNILMDERGEDFFEDVNEGGVMPVGEGRTIQVDENGDIQVLECINVLDKNTFASSRNQTIKKIKKKNLSFNESENSVIIEESLSCKPEPLEVISIVHGSDDSNDETLMNTGEEPVTLYCCGSCNMNFPSVMDHIKQYHDGQEVILDIGDTQLDESTTVETIPTTEPTSNLQVIKTSKKKKETNNLLKTEECIDSDGRSFTRKFVQINKFWNQSSSSNSPSKGPMIEKFFCNAQGVKVRGKTVKVPRIYKCDQCLEQFSKLSEYRGHACAQEKNSCEYCDQTFATAKALQAHCLKAHDTTDTSKVFKCGVCTTEFSTHKSLALHARMHAPVKSRRVGAPEGCLEEETFKCDECGKLFSESYRTAHMALHAGSNITCLICNRKFDSTESLKMHAAVHTDTKDTETSVFISTGDPLNDENDPTTSIPGTTVNTPQTQESIDLQNQKPYQCQHCGRRFTRPHEKVKHERIHTGEKPHSCEVCGKKFRVSYCLTLHMRTHTGHRPYECEQCGKRFKASSVYNHHLLTHGDERAYTCPYCPKTFKTRVQLAGHKNSHTKPFRCTECSRPFASLYAARSHMNTHKKDNNLKFSCKICGATYGRAFALKDHLKVHQNDDNALVPPEPTREEEILQVENFSLDDEEVVSNELIVPSPTGEMFLKIEKSD